MTLKRLVLEFRDGELIIRALYRRSLEDAPGPSTKRREREVAELTREGLSTALKALEERVDVVGTSGYSVREDLLSVAVPSSATDELREAAS